MRDQAERLRQLAQRSFETKGEGGNSHIIAITSGKGGVGKTNFTVNLALALQESGKRALVFDADLGMANIDVVLGVVPTYTLSHVIRGQKRLQDIMLEGPNGIKILPGSSGSAELSSLSEQQIQNLVNQWRILDESFDYILVDTGAGIHKDVLSFLQAADDIVVILTPEPPSITDSYGLIKVLSQKQMTSSLYLVINQAENDEEGNKIYRRVSNVIQEFLGIEVKLLGYIFRDEKVSASVKRQKPFLLEYPNSEAAKGIKQIVQKLLDLPEINGSAGGMKKFLTKMLKYFSS